MTAFFALYDAMMSISVIPPSVSVEFPCSTDSIRICELILSCNTLKLNAKGSGVRPNPAAADPADPWQDESLAAVTSQAHELEGRETAGVWTEAAGGAAEFSVEAFGRGEAHCKLPLVQGERDINVSKSVLLILNRFGDEKLNLGIIPDYLFSLLDNALSITAKYDTVMVEFVSAMIVRRRTTIPLSAAGPSSATQEQLEQQEPPQYSRRMGISIVDRASGLRYTASTPSSLVEQNGTPWVAPQASSSWRDIAFELSVTQITTLHRVLRTSTCGSPGNAPVTLILSGSDDLLLRIPLYDRDDIVGVFTYVFPVKNVKPR